LTGNIGRIRRGPPDNKLTEEKMLNTKTNQGDRKENPRYPWIKTVKFHAPNNSLVAKFKRTMLPEIGQNRHIKLFVL